MDNHPVRDENIRAEIISRELPNRSLAITGFNEHEHRLYATFEIAKKLYRCVECAGDLAIGAEHVVTRTIQKERGYDHHHVHEGCFQEKLLPQLGRLAIIKSTEATITKNNKRARRARAGKRR